MRAESKTFNYTHLTEDQRKALIIYLLGSAAYDNIFEHYGSAPYRPISDSTGEMPDVVLESYHSLLTTSSNDIVDNVINTVKLF